jgi:hypothetical protein
MSSHRHLIRGSPPVWEFGKGLTTPHHKKTSWLQNVMQGLRIGHFFGTPKQLDASGSGEKPVAGPCKRDNEPSGSIKGREFLD